MEHNEYNELLKQYSDLLKLHGPDDPRTTKWSTKQTQYFRFKILCEIDNLTNASVVDYGCGLGDMYDYLGTQGFRGTYTGIDINPDLLAAAKRKYPSAHFQQYGGQNDIPEADYVLMSGVFNENRNGRDGEMRKALTLAFSKAKKGVAYGGLYKGTMGINDPAELFSWCVVNLTQFVTLRQDYRGGNFTLYLYKDRGVDF